MKKFAYLFPGQGAQYSGMAVDLISSASVKSLFETASDIFGKDVKKLLESDVNTLKRTDVSQPAITAANLAAAAYLGEKGFTPFACAGFSLGEYAALVCAGIISTVDCLRLVKARGEIMQKAADSICTANAVCTAKAVCAANAACTDVSHNNSAKIAPPGMAAVSGLDPLRAEELIAEWKAQGLEDLFAANINSPKQLVISGSNAALAEAETRFKEAGAKRVTRLQVAGPFHSPLMNEAQNEFLSVLQTVSFSNPVIPVFSNVTGKIISSGAQAKDLMAMHITSPVRWVDEEASIAQSGIEACLETGPGKVLQNLWKDSGSEIPVFAAGTAEDIEKLRR